MSSYIDVSRCRIGPISTFVNLSASSQGYDRPLDLPGGDRAEVGCALRSISIRSKPVFAFTAYDDVVAVSYENQSLLGPPEAIIAT
jgi:hypothetical protein